jgi:hypothetical protein
MDRRMKKSHVLLVSFNVLLGIAVCGFVYMRIQTPLERGRDHAKATPVPDADLGENRIVHTQSEMDAMAHEISVEHKYHEKSIEISSLLIALLDAHAPLDDASRKVFVDELVSDSKIPPCLTSLNIFATFSQSVAPADFQALLDAYPRTENAAVRKLLAVCAYYIGKEEAVAMARKKYHDSPFIKEMLAQFDTVRPKK